MPTFALPEPRVGLAALAGGVHRLPRQIGLKRAMGMILSARHVSAKEGLELGFVNEVGSGRPRRSLRGTLGGDDLQELADVDPCFKQAIQRGLEVSLEQAIRRAR